MIIVLKPEITEKEIEHIIERVTKLGLKPMLSKGTERSIIGGDWAGGYLAFHSLWRPFRGVEKVMLPVLAPYRN